MFTAKTLFILMAVVYVLGLLLHSLSHIIRQRNLIQALRDYFWQKEFRFAPRLLDFYDFYVTGYMRHRAVHIWYFRGIRRKKTSYIGITIKEITVQLHTPNRFYLQIKPRSGWGKYFDRPHRWTFDPMFNYLFSLSSSPETFGSAVFGPRLELCEGLRHVLYSPGSGIYMSWFTLDIKGNQILLKGRSGRGYFVSSVDQLDELLNLLCDLADAIEETAAYFPQFEAGPIPDSALN